MKKLVGMLMVVGLASTSAFGGTVAFLNPSSPDSGNPAILSLDPGGAGTFDVRVTETTNNPGGSVDIIFLADLSNPALPEGDASQRGLGFGTWSFSTDFTNATFTRGTSTTTNSVVGAREFKVGGAALSSSIAFPMTIGTLQILASADLAPGDYFVDVSTTRESPAVSKVGKTGSPVDPLFGRGIVRITPEPATLALLGIGGLVALRRRRAR